MLARFERDVFAEKPDLVLWQVGSNSVLRDQPLAAAGALIREGLKQLRDAGADVILMNPQYAPKVITKHDAEHGGSDRPSRPRKPTSTCSSASR